jgi:hypothetical protein
VADSPTSMVETPPTEAGIGSYAGSAFTDPVPALSTTNSDLLAAAFASSPIHSGELTDAGIRANFINMVQHGEVQNGFMFPKFNRDYAENGITDPADVEGGAAGAPANGFTPNVASPGEGNGVDPIALPEPPNADASEKIITTPFEGAGSQVKPSETSAVIAGSTIGDYLSGKGTEFAE